MKTLEFSKDKFNSKIITHFEENGVYDYIENNKESFKLWFEETIHANTYQFDVEYTPDFDGVYYADEIVCTYENRHIELTLKTVNYNPKKASLHETLQDIIEKQKSRDEENNYDPDSMKGGRDYDS